MTAGAHRRGIGRALLKGLIAASEAEGHWTLQSQIMALNQPSRSLHLSCGFREVGVRERLGHLGDLWHDVVIYERRSRLTGGPGLPTKTCEA